MRGKKQMEKRHKWSKDQTQVVCIPIRIYVWVGLLLGLVICKIRFCIKWYYFQMESPIENLSLTQNTEFFRFSEHVLGFPIPSTTCVDSQTDSVDYTIKFNIEWYHCEEFILGKHLVDLMRRNHERIHEANILKTFRSMTRVQISIIWAET